MMPRERAGQASMASAAPAGHSAPIPMPSRMRKKAKKAKLGAKPAAKLQIEYQRIEIINGVLRPMRSQSQPEPNAPTRRSHSVKVTVPATKVRGTPNSCEIGTMIRKKMVKSKASSIQPRKPADQASHWSLVGSFHQAKGRSEMATVMAFPSPKNERIWGSVQARLLGKLVMKSTDHLWTNKERPAERRLTAPIMLGAEMLLLQINSAAALGLRAARGCAAPAQGREQTLAGREALRVSQPGRVRAAPGSGSSRPLPALPTGRGPHLPAPGSRPSHSFRAPGPRPVRRAGAKNPPSPAPRRQGAVAACRPLPAGMAAPRNLRGPARGSGGCGSHGPGDH